MPIYFDNAATTPIAPEVIAVMQTALSQLYGNPSSIHAVGRQSRAAIEAARKSIAEQIGAGIGEVFFTSGGTESNNMVLKNAVRDLGVQRIISSRLEHHCVLHTLDTLRRDMSTQIDFVRTTSTGHIDTAHLEQLLQAEKGKTLVSLMHANNEIGTLIDLKQIASLCQTYQAYFHTDTVQTMGFYPINVHETPIHFLSGSAHKFYGPKGVGFVYIRNDAMLKPYIDGGSQERNMRGGTENLYGIVGMAAALTQAVNEITAHQAYITDLRNYLKQCLLDTFQDVRINGETSEMVGTDSAFNHYKVLSASFPPSPKSELMLFNLDISGIAASGGSACSSGAESGSHVLEALGGDPLRKTIRFSFSHYNTKVEIDYAIEKMKGFVLLKAVEPTTNA